MFLSMNSAGRDTVILGAAASLVYAAMILGPLAQLAQIAGAPPLDMRPTGYSASQALAYLNELGPKGRKIYLWRQIPLDLVYPALMALTLTRAIAWARVPSKLAWLARGGTISAIGAAAADYVENLGITALLVGWPTPLPALAEATAIATVAKSATTTPAVCVTLACLMLRFAQIRFPGRA